MVKLGKYKTRLGLDASALKFKSHGPNSWIIAGAIHIEGISYIHHWNIRGESLSTNSNHDLVAQ